MPASLIVEGWEVFERWAVRFCSHANESRFGFALSHWHELQECILSDSDDPAARTGFGQTPSDQQRRARDKAAFLRDYFVDISFDAGPFVDKVKRLLKFQSPRFCTKGYGLWFGKWDIETEIFQGTMHFKGDEVCIFCGSFDDVDFASVMSVCPFDVLFVRNMGGVGWTKAEVREFIQLLKDDLAFDGIDVYTKKLYTGGYILWESILAIGVRIKSPKGVYFNYKPLKAPISAA